MKQDIIILSVIIAFFTAVLIIAYATPDQIKHTQCVLSISTQHDLVSDNGEKTTYLVADAKVLGVSQPLTEFIILATPLVLDGHPMWTQNIRFGEYKSGAAFACDVHLRRLRGYQTISEFDGVPNVANNVNERDRAYDELMSIVRGGSFIAASAYFIILVNILYGVPIISGFNLLYHKREEGERLGNQPPGLTTTI